MLLGVPETYGRAVLTARALNDTCMLVLTVMFYEAIGQVELQFGSRWSNNEYFRASASMWHTAEYFMNSYVNLFLNTN